MINTERRNIPKPGKPRKFKFPEFTSEMLGNGLEVLMVPKRRVPLVHTMLQVDLTPLDDGTHQEGQSYLLSQLLLEGTRDKNSKQIAFAFENLAADYNLFLSWTGTFFELNILRSNLSASLSLMSELLTDSILPENEFERLRKEILSDRMQIRDIPESMATEALFRQLFTEHRYALPLEGRVSSLHQITLASIRDKYFRDFPDRKKVLVIVGDFNKTRVLKQLERLWGSLGTNKEKSPTTPALPKPEKRRVLIVDKPGAAQTEIRLGQLLPERRHPDFYQIKLMNEIFGGYFLSRLNRNLRERNGFTYSIQSNLQYRPSVGLMIISTSVQNEFAGRTLEQIFLEIEMLQQEGVSQKEVEQASGYLIGVFPYAFESIRQVSEALTSLISFQLPNDYFSTFRERIAALTTMDILSAAQNYLDPEHMQIVMVGDAEIIRKQISSQYPYRIISNQDDIV